MQYRTRWVLALVTLALLVGWVSLKSRNHTLREDARSAVAPTPVERGADS